MWLCETKYGERTKLSRIDTDSFIVYINIEDIYVEISKGVKARFDISNYELERPLPKGKNKKLIELMKSKLSGKYWESLLIVDSIQ